MIVCFIISCVSLYLWLDTFNLGDFHTQLLRQPYAPADTRLLENARDNSFQIEMDPFISCMAFPSFLAKFYSFMQLFSYVCSSIKSISSMNYNKFKTNIERLGHNNFTKSIVE